MITPEIKQELQNRLSENLLQDSVDLMEFVQYSSRLAALGDEEAFGKLPGIFSQEPFSDQITDIFKLRCEQGIWEAEENFGEPLAFSLIDAQDFFCFQQRMGKVLPEHVQSELTPHFECWWNSCEDAELDEETADMLREFLAVYPIPENELLPVVGTPITETEYKLLETIYEDVQLPVIKMVWKSTSSCSSRTAGELDKPAQTLRPTLLLSCADEKPSDTLKKIIDSKKNTVETSRGQLQIGRSLNDAWMMQVAVDLLPQLVRRMRIGAVPIIQDKENPSFWYVDLKSFAPKKRVQLLEEPLQIKLIDGTTIQCATIF